MFDIYMNEFKMLHMAMTEARILMFFVGTKNLMDCANTYAQN